MLTRICYSILQAFAGIDSKANSTGRDAELKFQCDLENVVLSYGVFTDNLNWIKKLTFESCYIQDGKIFALSFACVFAENLFACLSVLIFNSS